MQKPLVSVVIPAYNEEVRIVSCLKAVFNQTLAQEKFEVIVVDNNSHDQTAALIKKNFPQTRIVVEKQTGAVFARIKGVEEAKAEIVAMTDADGTVPPDWLEKIIAPYKDPEIVGVGGSTNYDYKNQIIRLCEDVINFFDVNFNFFAGYNLSFRKDAYNKFGGFSTKINLCEDFYLSLKLKKYGKVIVLKDNPVTVSARRFFDDYFSYASKYIINVMTILVFDRPIFFKFKEVREETKAALATLKEKVKY